MLDLNTRFHDNISVKPKGGSNKVLLTEPQNEDKKPTRQYIRFPSNIKEYCVLTPEKMSEKWFTDTVGMCDYLVLYKLSDSICAVVIEMKSKKYILNQVEKQLNNGEKLLNCLCCFLDSCDVKGINYLLLYKPDGLKSKKVIQNTTRIKIRRYTPDDNSIDITNFKTV